MRCDTALGRVKNHLELKAWLLDKYKYIIGLLIIIEKKTEVIFIDINLIVCVLDEWLGIKGLVDVDEDYQSIDYTD